MLKGLGGLGDMAGMMAKAKEMQSKVEEAQTRVSEILGKQASPRSESYCVLTI